MVALRTLILTAFAAVSLANPIPAPELEARQIVNANDLENGVCKPVVLIFARGSTELGNMVSHCLPALSIHCCPYTHKV